ncbi:MAG: trypsin-like serine protease, partial [Candidatus Nanopelagicales bacterium]
MTSLSASSVEIQPFVVGGSNVTDWSEYPFQVGLVNKTSANFADGAYSEQFCGGVVVADTWIMTAAHCVTSVNQASGTFTLKDAANIGV